MREVIAETIGTFILVFIGTGAIMVNSISNGAVTHLGISAAFGAVVAALIYTIGHISGAHMNPAVTLAFWRGGYFPGYRVIGYISGQIFGACLASLQLRLCFGMVSNLGATLPLNGNWFQALALEIILTFILMLVILGAAIHSRAPKGFAGIAIGLTVGFEALALGPITGASMNPVRSFAPALLGGIWQYQWVYWIAPIVGAQLALVCFQFIFPKEEDR